MPETKPTVEEVLAMLDEIICIASKGTRDACIKVITCAEDKIHELREAESQRKGIGGPR